MVASSTRPPFSSNQLTTDDTSKTWVVVLLLYYFSRFHSSPRWNCKYLSHNTLHRRHQRGVHDHTSTRHGMFVLAVLTTLSNSIINWGNHKSVCVYISLSLFLAEANTSCNDKVVLVFFPLPPASLHNKTMKRDPWIWGENNKKRKLGKIAN